jgi:outer membrane protein insertion porin family
VDIGFREPYFLGREITAGVDLFRIRKDRQDTSSLDTDEYGGSTLFSYPILESLRQKWAYSIKQTEITDVSSTASQVIIDTQSANKKRLVSEINHTLNFDKRDSTVNPTDGYSAGITTGYAGLGGDATFVRNTVRGRYYYPVADQWVFSLVGSAGWVIGVGEDVSFLDRLFLGGNRVRGFDSAGIGPRDAVNKDALGAEWSYSGQAQLDFPLGLPDFFRLTGRVFTDLGSAGGIEEKNPAGSSINTTGSLRATVGIGFQWISPFGPVGLDFAIPYIKEEFDRTEIVRFNFGARI